MQIKIYNKDEIKALVCKQIDKGDFELDERGQVIFYTGIFCWDQHGNVDYRAAADPLYED